MAEGFHDVVVAADVRPKIPPNPGIESAGVLDYLQVLKREAPVGRLCFRAHPLFSHESFRVFRSA